MAPETNEIPGVPGNPESEETPPSRKPWTAPAIVQVDLLEAVASTCAGTGYKAFAPCYYAAS